MGTTDSITGTFDQDADHDCERRTRLETKKRDRAGNRQLEEIRRANQRRPAADVVRHAECSTAVEIDLNDGSARSRAR
jgi:hypothetical protein